MSMKLRTNPLKSEVNRQPFQVGEAKNSQKIAPFVWLLALKLASRWMKNDDK